jgi:hypothetical protein
LVPSLEQAFLEKPFAAHNTQNVQFPGGFVVAIENSAGWLHKLAIAGTGAQLGNSRSQPKVLGQQLHARKNPPY